MTSRERFSLSLEALRCLQLSHCRAGQGLGGLCSYTRAVCQDTSSSTNHEAQTLPQYAKQANVQLYTHRLQSWSTSPLTVPGSPQAALACYQKTQQRALSSSPSSNQSVLENSVPKWALPYVHLSRLHKPIGSWLLAWPCFWSIAMAATPGCLPDLYLLGLFGTGAVVCTNLSHCAAAYTHKVTKPD